MQRFVTLTLGSVLAVVIGFAAISEAGERTPVGEAPAAEAPSHGGFTPLAPDAADDEPFDPSQVQLEPGDPSPEDYVWDEDGNLVLRPDFQP